MEHSKKYNLVKEYYDNGAWSINRVHMAVEKQWITAKEYEEITGEVYVPDEDGEANIQDYQQALNALGVETE